MGSLTEHIMVLWGRQKKKKNRVTIQLISRTNKYDDANQCQSVTIREGVLGRPNGWRGHARAVRATRDRQPSAPCAGGSRDAWPGAEHAPLSEATRTTSVV